jgi:hypothetical protein
VWGLHWPKLDADLYIPALMQGVFGSRRWGGPRVAAFGAKLLRQTLGRARERAQGWPAEEARSRLALQPRSVLTRHAQDQRIPERTGSENSHLN